MATVVLPFRSTGSGRFFLRGVVFAEIVAFVLMAPGFAAWRRALTVIPFRRAFVHDSHATV